MMCCIGPRASLRLAALTAAVLFLAVPAARAAGPMLSVTNLGHAAAPVVVGQPPLAIAPAGECAHPFTLAGEAACPPGTWPPLGAPSWAPGGWAPTEDVAGGDTLQLAFSGPMTSVVVGSTSNYGPGLQDPEGRAIANYEVVPESPATATADPAVWQVALPPLDYRAIGGYTFSVVGQDGSGFHDYPLEIRSPRYADELARCGTAYYSTGVQQYLCPGGGVPTGSPGAGGVPTGGSRDTPRKAHRCRRRFRKRKVRGKKRCVRVKRRKKHRKRHGHHRRMH